MTATPDARALLSAADADIAAGRAYRAHESLEEAWRRARGTAEAPAWRVAIHVAVACHHAHRGNLRGARAQYERAARLADSLPEGALGLDVAHLRERLAERVREPAGTPPRLAAG